MPRALTGLALSALLAGCGVIGSGGSSPPSSTTSTVSGVSTQLSGSGASNNAAGKVVKSSQPAITHAAQGSISHQSQTVTLATGGGTVVGPSKTSTTAQTTSTASTTPTTSTTTSTAAKPAPATTPTTTVITRTVTTTVPASHPRRTGPTRIHTITVTKNQTVVRTVVKTKTVRPNVPSGAFLPSTHPALAQQSFIVPGGNIGCQLDSAGVRCGIQQRVWAPPVQPSSCQAAWGDTLALQTQGQAKFVCGGASPIGADAQVIPDGWDDTVGSITCQVRSLGVDCFSAKRSGFILSRTGYAFY